MLLLRSHTPESRRHMPEALLYEAERNPGTAAAEEALIWIVTHLPYGSMAERAKEMIARDHIRSEKIEPVCSEAQPYLAWLDHMRQSDLFREALAKNPHRKIQGLALLLPGPIPRLSRPHSFGTATTNCSIRRTRRNA